MRPVGEVRMALLDAARRLCINGRRATLRELAAAAQVGRDAARRTVYEMAKAEVLFPAGERRVSYRNRPVVEYALATAHAAAGPSMSTPSANGAHMI